MSTQKYQDLNTLKNGNYECKIKARVIRFWRGMTTQGEEFKGFNVLLLDEKNNPIHAFIPAVCAYEHERKLKLGNVCIITKFTVQAYKGTDKFRSLRNEKQLIFSKNTTIQQIEDKVSNIAHDWFDLYDHNDLKSLSQQNVYLADVVGIIKEHFPFTQLKNKHGKDQSQAKFTITDGSSNVRVTFWDNFGESFEKAMVDIVEKPVIVVLASVRVGWWNEKVNLSNVAATKFYLNYKHNSVLHLRKMLANPGFKQQALASNNRRKPQLLNLEELLKLGKESMDTEFLIHVKIVRIDESVHWLYMACTSCLNEIEKKEQEYLCSKCKRTVPYPDYKFKLCVVASDGKQSIDIILEDRQVRSLIGKRAIHWILENPKADEKKFPKMMNDLAGKDYTIKLCIWEGNILKPSSLYWASNICTGFKLQTDDFIEMSEPLQQSTTQETTSSYHLDNMSDYNTQASSSEQQKGKEVQLQ